MPRAWGPPAQPGEGGATRRGVPPRDPDSSVHRGETGGNSSDSDNNDNNDKHDDQSNGSRELP